MMTINIKLKKVGESWIFSGETIPTNKNITIKIILEEFGITIFEGGLNAGIEKLKNFLENRVLKNTTA